MFPFFGARRGKNAVLEVIKQIADNVRVHRFDRESVMLGEDSAASMMRYSLTALDCQQADQPAAGALRQFKAGRLSAFASWSTRLIWSSRRSGASIHLPKIAS